MLRVDLDERLLQASVGSLVADPDALPRPGSPLALARTRLGGEVHRAWQERLARTTGGFEAEVALQGVFEVDGFAVHLRGRADGVFRRGPRDVAVEEVKSVELDAAGLAEAAASDYPLACRQVRLYALLLGGRGVRVEPRLRLISILDGSERSFGVSFRRDRAHALLARLVRDQVARAHRRRDEGARRARIAHALGFPYGAERAGQQALSEAIAESLERGRPVLATAPTGTGKTVAALLPALRFALRHDARLFFLTAKTTQQELVGRTFDDVVEAAGDAAKGLRALTLAAKRGMCPPGTMLCHPDRCRHLARFLDAAIRAPVLDELVAQGPRVAPDDVLEMGRRRVVCPHALQLAMLADADLVIADFNHVYDPGVSADALFDPEADRRAVVVIDEAHNLFDRAREYDSPFLAETRIADLAERLEAGELCPPGVAGGAAWLPGLAPDEGPRVLEDLEALLGDLLETVRAAAARPAGPASRDGCRPLPTDAAAWAPLAARAASAMVDYAHMNLVHGILRADDPVLALLPEVLRLHEAHGRGLPQLLPYVADASARDGAGVGVLCVDPSARLAERHRQVLGTVAMSATLEPADYFERVLGFHGTGARHVALRSPFPEENREVLIVPSVSTTWRERARHYPAIAGLIRDVATSRAGNYVAYFPSFRFLEDVRAELDVPGVRVLAQGASMGARDRRAVLDTLRRADEPTLLLAVLGGVFGEGVDLPGEGLVGAILVGPGLPPVGFERDAMRHHFDDEEEGGFAYAMLYPGMQRVVQAAGRVHRTPEDRGVIVLLGRRFAREPYVGCLPSSWYRYAADELVTTQPADCLRAFWQGQLPLRSV